VRREVVLDLAVHAALVHPAARRLDRDIEIRGDLGGDQITPAGATRTTSRLNSGRNLVRMP
jgi:hypothetical protein